MTPSEASAGGLNVALDRGESREANRYCARFGLAPLRLTQTRVLILLSDTMTTKPIPKSPAISAGPSFSFLNRGMLPLVLMSGLYCSLPQSKADASAPVNLKGKDAREKLTEKADLSQATLAGRLAAEQRVAPSAPVQEPTAEVDLERKRLKKLYQERLAAAQTEAEIQDIRREYQILASSLSAERELKRLEKKEEGGK